MLTRCHISKVSCAAQLHTRNLNRQPFALHPRALVQPQRATRSPEGSSDELSHEKRDIAIACQTVAASVVGGGLLAGAGFGLEEALPTSVQHLSATLGWGYFAVWSLSFYPQVRTHAACMWAEVVQLVVQQL